MPAASRPVDLAEAVAFLDALAGAPNAVFTFQTYADDRLRPVEERRALARTLTGQFSALCNTLVAFNNAGASICVAVNPQSSPVRSNANTIYPRACWHENDDALHDGLLFRWPVPPSMVVQTRPGHQHFYWLIDRPPGSASPEEWAQWYGVGRHLITHLQSDPKCLKRSQVLRVPGFYWAKNPAEPSRVKLIRGFTGQRYPLAALVKAFPAPEPVEAAALAFAGQTDDDERDNDLQLVTDSDFAHIVSALDHINPDQSREVWINVLMALEYTRHPERRNVGDAWSQSGGLKDTKNPVTLNGPASEFVHEKYLTGEPEAMMRSFRERADKLVRPGTIIALARDSGWTGSAPTSLVSDFASMVQGEHSPEPVEDFTVESYAELDAIQWPERRWLVSGMIPADSTATILTGDPGTGKSYLALALAASGATATRFVGANLTPPPAAFATTYVDLGENGRDISHRRLHAIFNRTAMENPLYSEAVAAGRNRVLNVWTPKLVYPLVAEAYGGIVIDPRRIAKLRDVFLRAQDRLDVPLGCAVIDNLPKLTLANENSTAVALSIIDAASNALFRDFPHAGLILVAHSRKGDSTTSAADRTGGAVRGASAFAGMARSVMLLRRTVPKEAKKLGLPLSERRDWRYLVCDKLNFAREPDPVLLHFEHGCWWYRDVTPMTEDDRQYLAFRTVVTAFLSHPSRLMHSTSITAVIGRRNRGAGQDAIPPLAIIDPCDDDRGYMTQQQVAEFAERAIAEGWLIRGREGNEHVIRLRSSDLLI